MGLTVRRAGADELAVVGALTVEAYRAAGLLEDSPAYAQVLQDAAGRAAGSELLVAVEDGQVVGTATSCLPGSPQAEVAAPDEAELRMLAVAPGLGGRGIGTALVRACAERARSAGLRRLVLSTQSRAHAAHRVYGRLGFRRQPERDWDPVPAVHLEVWVLEVVPPAGAPEVRPPDPAGAAPR